MEKEGGKLSRGVMCRRMRGSRRRGGLVGGREFGR